MMFSLENMYDPYQDLVNSFKCPSCKSMIPWDRPILLMDNMQFVYPCSDCEWVWERQLFNMRKFVLFSLPIISKIDNVRIMNGTRLLLEQHGRLFCRRVF